jgi:phage baseplate assembly protein V
MVGPTYTSDDFNQTSLNLLRSGTVIDRRNGANGPEVRVSFPDRDISSDWLPVSQSGSGGMSFHHCPRVGANVLVAHIGTGVERGLVLGSNPTENGGSVIPNSLNSLAMLADDGAQFEYNPDTGQLLVGGVATIKIVGGGTITIVTGGDIDATAGGNANVTAATATIKAGSITLDGNVRITGTLTVVNTVTFQKDGTIATHLTNLDGAGAGS